MSAPETQRAGLVEQLKEAIDEDERIAKAAIALLDSESQAVPDGGPQGPLDAHNRQQNPWHIAAMVAAHREILDVVLPLIDASEEQIHQEFGLSSDAAHQWPSDLLIAALAKGYGIEVD